jgi:hypothetical protein
MDNDQFITRINRILTRRGVSLPVLDANTARDSRAVAAWAGFLEECVRGGIQLSDPRWKRLRVVQQAPVTKLALEGEDAPRDDEFKVGLQLLVGILSGKPPR